MTDFDWKYLSSNKLFETTVSIHPTRDVTPLEKQPTRGDFWTGVFSWSAAALIGASIILLVSSFLPK